jgi:hypothetical protein
MREGKRQHDGQHGPDESLKPHSLTPLVENIESMGRVGASQIAKEFGLFGKTDKQSVGDAILPMRCDVANALRRRFVFWFLSQNNLFFG